MSAPKPPKGVEREGLPEAIAAFTVTPGQAMEIASVMMRFSLEVLTGLMEVRFISIGDGEGRVVNIVIAPEGALGRVH